MFKIIQCAIVSLTRASLTGAAVAAFSCAAGASLTSAAGTATKKIIALDYSLPLAPEHAHLLPFATFPNGAIEVARDKKNVIATYVLPLALTGVPMKLKFSGVVENEGEFSLSGPDGQLNCIGHVCAVQFARFPIDEVAVERFLLSSGIRGLELEARKNVAAIFRADPGGTIELKEPF